MSKQVFNPSNPPAASFDSTVSFAPPGSVNSIDSAPVAWTSSAPTTPISPEPYIQPTVTADATTTVGVGPAGNGLVVGWLVCISGETKGKSYELRTKWNTVGRGMENDVCIDDRSVSRESMISIAYDDRSKQYFLRRDAGGRDHFVHYNGENEKNHLLLLTDSICLKAYDTIDIGDTVTLLFVPFCGEKFTW